MNCYRGHLLFELLGGFNHQGKNQLEDGQTTFDIFFFDQQNCIPFIFHGACYCTKYRWWSWEHLGQAGISWGSILEKALPAVKRVASYIDGLCQASMSYVEDWLRPGSRWENHQHFIQEAFLIVHCSCHCKVFFFTWVDSMQLYRYTRCISFCAKNIVERQHQPFNYLVESWVFPNVQIPGVIENMTKCAKLASTSWPTETQRPQNLLLPVHLEFGTSNVWWCGLWWIGGVPLGEKRENGILVF